MPQLLLVELLRASVLRAPLGRLTNRSPTPTLTNPLSHPGAQGGPSTTLHPACDPLKALPKNTQLGLGVGILVALGALVYLTAPPPTEDLTPGQITNNAGQYTSRVSLNTPRVSEAWVL